MLKQGKKRDHPYRQKTQINNMERRFLTKLSGPSGKHEQVRPAAFHHRSAAQTSPKGQQAIKTWILRYFVAIQDESSLPKNIVYPPKIYLSGEQDKLKLHLSTPLHMQIIKNTSVMYQERGLGSHRVLPRVGWWMVLQPPKMHFFIYKTSHMRTNGVT